MVDVHWSDISFLVGFNDGPVDEGPRQIGTFSLEGDPVSVLDGAFGTNSISMLFDGDGDGVIVGSPATAGCDFGTGDFTIELWLKNEDSSWTTYFHSAIGNFDGSDPGSWSLFVQPSNDGGYLTWSVDGLAVSDRVEGTSNLTGVTSFNHVAVTRSGGTLRVYANGVMEGKHTGYTFDVAGTGDVKIGANNAGDQDRWKGRIDEVRVTKGVARYTTDTSFSPPTAPFYRAPMMQAYPGLIQAEGQRALLFKSAVAVQDPYWNEVSFLIGYDFSVADQGPRQIDVTPSGSPSLTIPMIGAAAGAYNRSGGNDYRNYVPADRVLNGRYDLTWYWEFECNSTGPSEFNGYVAVVSENQLNDSSHTYNADENPVYHGSLGYRGTGDIWGNGANSLSAHTAYGAGDVVMIAFNPASGGFWVGLNGTWSTDPDVDPPAETSDDAGLNFTPVTQAREVGEGGTLRSVSSQFSYSIPSVCRALGDLLKPEAEVWAVEADFWVEMGPLADALTVGRAEIWHEFGGGDTLTSAVTELWIEKDTT